MVSSFDLEAKAHRVSRPTKREETVGNKLRSVFPRIVEK